MTGNPDLIAAIRREIQERGPMTFARYMELALYHPEHGYYTSGRARIGREGDFITSPAVGPVFGRLLGACLARMWDQMERPDPFILLELGSHAGWLAEDILAWSRQKRPDFADAAEYWICERDRSRITAGQREARWFADWGEIESESVVGCIFSNELLDAFSVHRIRNERFEGRQFADLPPRLPRKDEWQELYVEIGPVGWKWKLGRLSFPAASLPPPLLELAIPDHYTTEVNLRALDWLREMHRILKRGYLLTIDYGFTESEYYAPHRTDGTLMCYHKQLPNNEPLERVGEQDITAHVNFSALILEGTRLGLDFVQFTDQSRFLTDIGKEEIELIVSANPGRLDKTRRQLQTLLHPGGFGRTFKVLVQQKGVSNAKLSGLRYSRPL